MKQDIIKDVWAREILNAKGKPTVEVELTTEGNIVAVASSPSGTSQGSYEAFEKYDNEDRYNGYGVRSAVAGVNSEIKDVLVGRSVLDQETIDRILIELDGTKNKRRLGGNAILAVSVASAKARAMCMGVPLYRSFKASKSFKMPGVTATVIAGGAFSSSTLEFEDYIYVIEGIESFAETLDALASMRTRLEKNLEQRFGTVPLNGGALAPPLTNSNEAFDYMLEAANQTGYAKYVSLGLDVAANELYDEKIGVYELNGNILSESMLLEVYLQLCEKYPLRYIEDGFEENSFAAFARLKNATPDNVQIVGDDLFATNTDRLLTGFEFDAANSLLLKINQIGTVSEAIKANDLAKAHGYDIIVSMRSGETADDFIADLTVGIGARQIKIGSPVVLERNVKYNRLTRIEYDLIEK